MIVAFANTKLYYCASLAFTKLSWKYAFWRCGGATQLFPF